MPGFEPTTIDGQMNEEWLTYKENEIIRTEEVTAARWSNSVTRWWYKNSPIFPKIAPNDTNFFYLKVMFSKYPQKSYIWVTFWVTLSPRTFEKNRPIWSHCQVKVSIFLICSSIGKLKHLFHQNPIRRIQDSDGTLGLV